MDSVSDTPAPARALTHAILDAVEERVIAGDCYICILVREEGGPEARSEAEGLMRSLGVDLNGEYFWRIANDCTDGGLGESNRTMRRFGEKTARVAIIRAMKALL